MAVPHVKRCEHDILIHMIGIMSIWVWSMPSIHAFILVLVRHLSTLSGYMRQIHVHSCCEGLLRLPNMLYSSPSFSSHCLPWYVTCLWIATSSPISGTMSSSHLQVLQGASTGSNLDSGSITSAPGSGHVAIMRGFWWVFPKDPRIVIWLGGWTNPPEKICSQNWESSKIGVNWTYYYQ